MLFFYGVSGPLVQERQRKESWAGILRNQNRKRASRRRQNTGLKIQLRSQAQRRYVLKLEQRFRVVQKGRKPSLYAFVKGNKLSVTDVTYLVVAALNGCMVLTLR